MLGTRRRLIALTTVLALAGAGALAAAQQPSRQTDREVKQLLTRIEKNAEQFRLSLSAAADLEWIGGWEKERNIDHFVTGFAAAARRLRVQSDSGRCRHGSCRRGAAARRQHRQFHGASPLVRSGDTRLDDRAPRSRGPRFGVQRPLEPDHAAPHWRPARHVGPLGRGKPRSMVNRPASTGSKGAHVLTSVWSHGYADQAATRSDHRPTRRGIDAGRFHHHPRFSKGKAATREGDRGRQRQVHRTRARGCRSMSRRVTPSSSESTAVRRSSSMARSTSSCARKTSWRRSSGTSPTG